MSHHSVSRGQEGLGWGLMAVAKALLLATDAISPPVLALPAPTSPPGHRFCLCF